MIRGRKVFFALILYQMQKSEKKTAEERAMRTLTMKIDGMHCDGCADRIHSLLEKETGIRTAEVSYGDANANVTFNEHATSADRITEIVERAGFSVLES